MTELTNVRTTQQFTNTRPNDYCENYSTTYKHSTELTNMRTTQQPTNTQLNQLLWGKFLQDKYKMKIKMIEINETNEQNK